MNTLTSDLADSETFSWPSLARLTIPQAESRHQQVAPPVHRGQVVTNRRRAIPVKARRVRWSTMLLSRQHGARLLARVARAQGRGAASLAEPVETAVSAPAMPPCEFTPLPYDGPSREEVLSLRKRFLSPGTPNTTCCWEISPAEALQSCHVSA